MAFIPLSCGLLAEVDDEDVARINAFGKWFACEARATFYAVRNRPMQNGQPRGALIKMHRVILDAPEDMQIDHRDGNGLNNKKSNLRIATAAQNRANGRRRDSVSGFKGVVKASANRWYARITVDNKGVYLGCHKTAVDAARVYDAAALWHFGEFAVLNFQEGRHVAS